MNVTNYLEKLGSGQAFLKSGCFGVAGSGKTYTGLLLLCAVKRLLGVPGPIAMIDSERGSDYLGVPAKALTGEDLLGFRTRAFCDLVEMGKAIRDRGVRLWLVDSITHFWEELNAAKLAEINKWNRAKGRPLSTKLDFHHQEPVKTRWREDWLGMYLNSPIHIHVCGRAATIWGQDIDDGPEGRKKNFVAKGVKMKAEGDFTYEPGLVFEMERLVDETAHPRRLYRQGGIIKDRYGVLDGRTIDFPTCADHEENLGRVIEFFGPHIKRLTQSEAGGMETAVKTAFNDPGIARNTLIEQVNTEIRVRWGSQSSEDKAARKQAMQTHFGVDSWTKMVELPDDRLGEGLAGLAASPKKEDEIPF